MERETPAHFVLLIGLFAQGGQFFSPFPEIGFLPPTHFLLNYFPVLNLIQNYVAQDGILLLLQVTQMAAAFRSVVQRVQDVSKVISQHLELVRSVRN
jgi:hypothetical protein